MVRHAPNLRGRLVLPSHGKYRTLSILEHKTFYKICYANKWLGTSVAFVTDRWIFGAITYLTTAIINSC